MIKKAAAVLLAAIIIISTLGGCRKEKSVSDDTSSDVRETMHSDLSLKIIENIDNVIPLSTPGIIEDDILKDDFKINPDDLEEYYGKLSISAETIDVALCTKPKADKKDSIILLLNNYLNKLKNDSSLTTNEKEKVNGAKIIIKGDYVILLIIGNVSKGINSEIAKAEGIISNYIK